MRSASANLSSHPFASRSGSPQLPQRSRSIISSKPARNLSGSVSSAETPHGGLDAFGAMCFAVNAGREVTLPPARAGVVEVALPVLLA
jgi:hypothetical protein